MTTMAALQGLLPLLIFVVVDLFASMRVALLAAMAMAIAEAIWSYSSYGEVDQLTWVSLGLVIVMGAVSIKMKSDKLFKMQPVALAAIIAGTMGYFQFADQPLLLQMLPKVAAMVSDEQKAVLLNPEMEHVFRRLDLLMIVGFIAHGGLVAWAAMHRTTFVWILARGVGFYVIMGLVVLINAMLGR